MKLIESEAAHSPSAAYAVPPRTKTLRTKLATRIRDLTLCTLLLLSLTPNLPAAIQVQGVADRTVYVDTATFTVVPQSGFTYTATLNGKSINIGGPVVCTPDYYDLVVTELEIAKAVEVSRLIRFIVRSSERQTSEVGLRPWTPLPLVNSSTPEFVGSKVEWIIPAALPAGLPVPMVAQIINDQGSPVRLNGICNVDLPASTPQSFQLRRSIGSGHLILPESLTGALHLTNRVASIEATRSIVIEPNTTWTTIGGKVTGVVSYPDHSRLVVTQSLAVASNATLTFGQGTVLAMSKGVDIDVHGTLRMEGTSDAPIVVLPKVQSEPWGGMMFRTASATGSLARTFFTGSGANAAWFTQNTGYSVHRKEQALVLAENGAHVEFDQCWLIDNHGQAGHSKNAFVTYSNTLIQRCITAGEYVGGSTKLLSASLLEFPVDDDVFADLDNDGIYFTSGDHYILNSLLGWAKDDAMDAGSGGFGTMTVSNCWVESTYHEGMAWSGDNGRTVQVRNSIIMNCGQGIECGFGKPNVDAAHILSLGNSIGARFGDNYDWTYAGFLRVTNSLLLENYKDIWGQTWTPGAWTNELDQMDMRGNKISRENPLYPGTSVWNPESDADLLKPFLRSPESATVGVAFQKRTRWINARDIAEGVPVGLSRFQTQPVGVHYQIADASGQTVHTGTLDFPSGSISRRIQIPPSLSLSSQPFLLTIQEGQGTEITGLSRLIYVPPAASYPPVTLVASNARWAYWDKGSEPVGNWKTPSYDDSAWPTGPARLGFGNDGEVTTLASGPSNNRHMAYYFRHAFNVPENVSYDKLTVRLLRDDGGIVYLNGEPVFRSNMPEGEISYSTPASAGTTSETEFFPKDLPGNSVVPGANELAVEVHQSGPTSGDLGFALELIATPTPPPPQLYWGYSNGNGFLAWNSSKAQLESSATLQGPWTPHPTNDPWFEWNLSTLGTGQRFFRLQSAP